ncbi:MAG: hypothetical protein ABW072_11690 [Sedimenticola sp.]
MAYSDWQLNRIRDALRAFRQYSHVDDPSYYEHYDEKGKRKRASLVKSFTWADVREAIAVATGVEIGVDMKKGAERLRQFVEGINDKENPGQKKFPVLKAEWLAAAVEFVTDKDKELLSEGELEEQAVDVHAALRLSEYLGPSRRDKVDQVQPIRLAGIYRNRKLEREEFAVRELTLHNSSEEGLVQAVVTEAFYSPDAEQLYAEWSRQQRQDEQYTHFKYSGWALITPEANLLFFLKEASYQGNRYYVTVASDFDRLVNEPAQLLALFLNDKPTLAKLAPEEGGVDKITENISAKLTDRLYVFAREPW